MHPSLTETEHRPYPLPSRPWRFAQVWEDLLFVHWPVPAAALRRRVPLGLEVEEHGGTAWLGVVPFRLRIRVRGLPALPRVQVFPELNVRTYVRRDGRPGVWFFSLDAPSRIAIWAARRLYHLPYRHAAMAIERRGDGIEFRAARTDDPALRFTARYRPNGPVSRALPGSLDHFLTERYCLYAEGRGGRLLRGEVHHRPWPLRPAEVEIAENTMASPLGIGLTGEPRLAWADRIEVTTWGPEVC